MSMTRYLPEHYLASPETVEYYKAIDPIVDALQDTKDDILCQFVIDTATWGLALWEQEYGIITDISKPDEYRRSRLRAKIRGQGTTTVALLKNVAESFTNGQVEVEEIKGQYKIIFWFTSSAGIPPNITDLGAAVREVIPAHIQYGFSYTYDTHEMLSRFTHAQLGMMTHGQVRHDVPHKKMGKYTHHQLRLIKHG